MTSSNRFGWRAAETRGWGRGSGAELARRAGIPASQLCAYETSAKQPTTSTLARLLEVCGTSLGLADDRTERMRQAAELVDVLGLLEALPTRQPRSVAARPFRELIAD